MDRQLSPWPTGPRGTTDPAATDDLTDALRAALDGTGPALAPFASGAPRPGDVATTPTTVPDDVALVLRTSGSTGGPRAVALGRDALLASAHATQSRLGGPGRWVLALPVVHVAGIQVLVRSVVAGTTPVVLAAGSFTPEALAAAAEQASTPGPPAGRGLLCTALVATQLHRVVEAARSGRLPASLEPLLRFDAVLVGGSAAPAPLVSAARDLGLRVVTTYGMTETCGGCVYDGVPLDGVDVELEPDGTIRLTGPVLAHGYLPPDHLPPGDGWVTAQGRRWLRTPDLGRWNEGRLDVLGRRDDVLVSGGVKVLPAQVEDVLAGLAGVAQVCVVGVPDAEWGVAVTAVVVPSSAGPPVLDDVRAAVSRTLGSAAAPRHLVVVDRLPERGPGKVDRAAVARLATARDGA